jgi:hypothetical protein
MHAQQSMKATQKNPTRSVARPTTTLEARVEAICARGCRQVHEDIARLEQGGELPETAGLNAGERARILDELKAVMAVYGDRCALDTPTSSSVSP